MGVVRRLRRAWQCDHFRQPGWHTEALACPVVRANPWTVNPKGIEDPHQPSAPQKLCNKLPTFPLYEMEGVRVNDSSVGKPKQIQTPCAWNKEKNCMKSLNTSNQPSSSLWGMKPGSLALIATVAIVCLAAFVGSQPSQAQSEAILRLPRLTGLTGAWSVETTVEIAQATFPTLATFTSDGIVLGDEPSNPFETTAHGNWVATGPRSAAFTFRAFIGLEINGQLSASLKVVGKLEFDARADKWSGPFKTCFTPS